MAHLKKKTNVHFLLHKKASQNAQNAQDIQLSKMLFSIRIDTEFILKYGSTWISLVKGVEGLYQPK